MSDSKGRPSKFRIAIVNNADPENPAHWDTNCSVRESRAIQRARRLRAEGNRFVILFKETKNGLRPISLKVREPRTWWLEDRLKAPGTKVELVSKKADGSFEKSGPISDEEVDLYRALLATNNANR